MAFVTVAAKRMAQNRNARLALFASPAFAIFFFAAIFATRRGALLATTAMIACLWIGGAIAVYVVTGQPGARRPLRAIAIGLPLGVAYFAAALVIAIGAVLLIRTMT